jgi:hypothetical protein
VTGFVKIFSTCLILTFTTLSQEITDSLQIKNQTLGLNKRLSTVLDNLDFYLDLHDLNKTLFLNADPNTTWLWTSYAISSQAAFQSNLNFDDMTLHLYKKYLEDSKFNPFRYALGMMQVGAVGYLAYKHIKKYGFLKK